MWFALLIGTDRPLRDAPAPPRPRMGICSAGELGVEPCPEPSLCASTDIEASRSDASVTELRPRCPWSHAAKYEGASSSPTGVTDSGVRCSKETL